MREEAVRRRAAAHAADPTAGDRLAAHFSGVVADLKPGIAAAYWPIRDEIDPIPALVRLIDLGWRGALPVVRERDGPLTFCAWAPGDPLADGTFGLSHPLPNADTVSPDLFLVPGLAFDPAGCRLGYGGGYYDRTLNEFGDRHPAVVGVCYDDQIVDAVPSGPDDIRVGRIMSESRTIDCRAGAGSREGT